MGPPLPAAASTFRPSPLADGVDCTHRDLHTISFLQSSFVPNLTTSATTELLEVFGASRSQLVDRDGRRKKPAAPPCDRPSLAPCPFLPVLGTKPGVPGATAGSVQILPERMRKRTEHCTAHFVRRCGGGPGLVCREHTAPNEVTHEATPARVNGQNHAFWRTSSEADHGAIATYAEGSRLTASDDMRKRVPFSLPRVGFHDRSRGVPRARIVPFNAESLSGRTRERRSATTSDSRRSLEGRP